MKKIALLAPVLTLFAVACASTAPTESVKHYSSSLYNLSLDYPAEWQEAIAPDPYINLSENLLVLQLPRSAYPQSNFGDATFGLSTEAADSLEACLASNPKQTLSHSFSTEDTTTSKDGLTFYTLNETGAAAGNIYESRVKRTYLNGQCFDIAESLHTMQIGNYPEGTVSEVDANAVWEQLDSLFNALHFTDPTPMTSSTNDLQIEDIKEGSGNDAKSGDVVEVRYTGTLTDGTVFDSSEAHGTTFSFTLGAGQVIPGWDQGVVGMKVGGERKLTIPSDLAYGDSGIPGVIPGGATLVFDIELVSIQAQ